MGVEWLRPATFFGSILFALIGVVIFWISFIIIDKITPYDLWAEIVEKQNRALAMVVAASPKTVGVTPLSFCTLTTPAYALAASVT